MNITIQVFTKQFRSTKKGLNPRDQKCFLEKTTPSDGDRLFQAGGQGRGHEERPSGPGAVGRGCAGVKVSPCLVMLS